jgi:hypothetical protein
MFDRQERGIAYDLRAGLFTTMVAVATCCVGLSGPAAGESSGCAAWNAFGTQNIPVVGPDTITVGKINGFVVGDQLQIKINLPFTW